MKREIKAYIEAELRDYHDTLQAIEDDREMLIDSAPVPNNIGGTNYDIGNPTQAKALQLITNRRVKRMEDTCRAIAKVIDALPEDKYKLVMLRYWTRPQTLTDEGIAREIGIDRSTLYRWADSIIKCIGIELGLINSCDNVATFRGA